MQPTSARAGAFPQVRLNLKRVCWKWVACASALLVVVVQGQTVQLADPNLESVIREVLQLPDGEITRADMGRIETLSARRRNIVSLEGFEGATNLQDWDMAFNELSEVQLPADLVSLTILNLQGNPDQAGLTSRELGAQGGNVASLDGSVRWKSIDQMKPYRGSRLWGSGGCFAVW